MRPLDPTGASATRCAFYATSEDERALEEIAKLRYPNRTFVTKSEIVREALKFTARELAAKAAATIELVRASGLVG
jgi:hypothetical protein